MGTGEWEVRRYRGSKTASQGQHGGSSPGFGHLGVNTPLQVSFGHFLPRAMLNGKLAEVRLWSYARSERETARDMGVSMFGDEPQCQGGKLTALWKLSDKRVVDLVANPEGG